MADRDSVIKGLEFTKAMITFNPSTGENIEPENLNEENKTSYDACVGAIELLKSKKPPIGLMPKEIHELKRIHDILDAMERYSNADFPIPIEWIEELRVLLHV